MYQEERKTLSEVYQFVDGLTGVFNDLYTAGVPLPWLTDEQQPATVIAMNDMDYYFGHSGDKMISPLVARLLDENGVLDSLTRAIIANIVKTRFLLKWTKLWNSLNLEYNPLNNYDMAEEMTDDETVREYGKTKTRTPTLTYTKTGTETNTPDVTETETPSVTRTDKVRGFNSTEDVPSGSATSSGTKTVETHGNNEIEYDITEEQNGTEEWADSGSDTNTRNYTLTFRGRVGNFSPAEMLEKEFNFRAIDYFRSIVYTDIDSILTLAIY